MVLKWKEVLKLRVVGLKSQGPLYVMLPIHTSLLLRALVSVSALIIMFIQRAF